jgi:hypothetical protein
LPFLPLDVVAILRGHISRSEIRKSVIQSAREDCSQGSEGTVKRMFWKPKRLGLSN